ncbi:MAG: HlyD family efflux transporter periplasmic adaptor subunit [Herbinix sp.]|nr:HlyD family efflux transporter periplasmic adaptor subunit [Herbinix sp.]
MSDQNKVVKFKKRKSINIGIVVFLILFLYIAINVYIYFTKDQLSIYEVQEGSTAVDNRVTALILRQEKLIYSDKAGYVLYYQKDGARVAKNSSIYSVNDSQVYNADSSEEAIVLTDKNEAEIKHDISTLKKSFSNDNFVSIYDFQENLQSTVSDVLNSSLVNDGQALGNVSGSVTSQESGIIAYYMDNFETVTSNDVTTDMFNLKNYQKTNLRTIEKISKNTPVYKMISSENWNLILPLTKDQYDKLSDKDRVRFTILENDIKMLASLELSKKGSDYFAVLSMNKDLSNYLGERYLEIELNFDSVEGLKIPLTSVVEKDFYEVPITYFTQGGDSKEKGLIQVVYNKNGDIDTLFVPTEIYYQDDDNAYIDTQLFEPGTKIQASVKKNTDQYTISKMVKLSGVYNVNLGYAVFKYIEILYQNEEYCIVSKNTTNGLSAYDHIALVGETAVDQQIIY